MTPSLDEIAAYVEVVEQKSFSAAANRMGLSTSVISKRVRALEERLETQLLQRTTRKITVTQAGELFFAEVRQLPALVEQAEEKVRDFSGRVEGRLRVVMPSYFENDALHAEVIPRYLDEHPGVELTLTIVANPVDSLADDFDLLIVGKLPHQQFPDTSLKGRRLLKLRGELFATTAYLDEHGRPEHPSDLEKHNCLSYLNNTWHFTDEDGEEIVIASQGNLRTNSNRLLRATTLAGAGITYSFPVFFKADVEAGTVERVLPHFTKGSYIDLHIFYPNAQFVPQRTRAFIDALVAHLSG